MEKNVTYLLSKLIFQKTSLQILISILFGALIVVIVTGFPNLSCNVEHVVLSNTITSYERSLDPEICENILERIDMFNDKCHPPVEILDCG